MKLNLETLYREDPVKACSRALRRTSKIKDGEERLQKINSILRGYGIEGIHGSWQNGYWCDVVASYVNMGDTYAPTVLRVRDRGFMVMSWGDFIERYSKEYEIK